MGKNGFVWWTGVVEDINDPLRLGRLRVRIIGFHTENKTLLPTSALPWAVVLQPITSAATSGIGTSPTGAVAGSWVMGFFRDGWSAQDPVIMGTFAGIPEKLPVKTEGFSDPNEKYPTPEYLGESDVNRLARGDKTVFTVVDAKRQTRVQGVRTALGGAWSEPGTPYRAIYPMNNVTYSRSGHIIEIDDTSFAPRVHIYHNSGSFIEMHPNGTVVDKVVGDDFEIDMKNKKIVIKGNMTETVDGNKRELVGGGYSIEVLGNLNTLVHGDHFVHTLGNYYHKVNGSFTVAAGGKGMVVAKRLDINPPEITYESFPDLVSIKDAPPSRSSDVSTRGNVPESNKPPSNLSQVRKFDTQVGTLEKQKAAERKENASPAAEVAKQKSSNAVPSPSSSTVGSAASKVSVGTSEKVTAGTAESPIAQSGSYLLPSRKKDCVLYCTEVIKNTGGSDQDYQYCIQECEAYNRQIDTTSASMVGKDADCGSLGGLDVGGVLGPIQDAVGEVAGAIEGAISGIGEAITEGLEDLGEAIFGTKEERYCKEQANDTCYSSYRTQARYGSSWGAVVPPYSEYKKECLEAKGDTGLTLYEECLQWCKDNPEEFAEIMKEREGPPVPSLSPLNDLGSLLSSNIPLPGLPSIPCLGIGIATIASIGAGVAAGIAIADAVEGPGGVVAGVAGGVLTAAVVSSAISPSTTTIEPPEPAPIDNTADAGSF